MNTKVIFLCVALCAFAYQSEALDISGFFKDIGETIKDATNKIGNTVTGKANEVKDTLQKLVNSGSDKAKEVVQVAALKLLQLIPDEVAQKILPMLIGKKRGIFDLPSEILAFISKAVTDVKDKFQYGFIDPQTVEKIEIIVKKVEDKLMEKNEAIKQIIELLHNIREKIASKIEDAFSKSKDIVSNILSGVLGHKEVEVRDLLSTATNLLAGLQTVMDGVKQQADDILLKFLDDLIEFLD